MKLWPMKNDHLSPCDAERHRVAGFDICPTDDFLILIADTDQQAHLWNLEHGLPAADLEQAKGVRSAFFSPDGERIVTVHQPDNELKLWTKDGHFIKTCCKHADPIHAAKYSPDGSLITTSSLSNDAGIKLWTENGKLFEIPGIGQDPISKIQFSPDGKRILVQAKCKKLIFDRSSEIALPEIKIPGFDDAVVRFSPDSRRLLVANEKALSVFDFEAPRNPTVIEDNDIYLHYN